MELAPPEGETDRISDLPEEILLHILSFLPTRLAARTSLLSRRFCRLWASCPALDIDIDDFEHLPWSDLIELTDRTLLRRNPASPLHRLHLRLPYRYWYDRNLLSPSFVSLLLSKAGSLGVRHLTVRLEREMIAKLLPLIFSISSLESLSLRRVSEFSEKYFLSSSISLMHLKTLSIYITQIAYGALNRLISHLHALEDLNLTIREYSIYLDLKFVTIKRLKLVLSCFHLKISTPLLEFFEINTESFRHFELEMPVLKTAVIQLRRVIPMSVPSVREMLMIISHVEELHLDIEEISAQKYPYHALVATGLDVPTFTSLKHLNLHICFHKYNIEDLVTVLQHSPALESLKLVHKPPIWPEGRKKKILWRSRLPQNAEGNYRHAYFCDLHNAEKKEELLRKLSRKPSSKKRSKRLKI